MWATEVTQSARGSLVSSRRTPVPRPPDSALRLGHGTCGLGVSQRAPLELDFRRMECPTLTSQPHSHPPHGPTRSHTHTLAQVHSHPPTHHTHTHLTPHTPHTHKRHTHYALLHKYHTTHAHTLTHTHEHPHTHHTP